MKQLALYLRTGKVSVLEVPVPVVRSRHLLIKTHKSIISTGTEKMLVEFGSSSLLKKAMMHRDRVGAALAKMKADGFRNTVVSISRKLDELLPMGYSQVGEVVAVGREAGNWQVGDRVISNGCHAEYVCVPVNLAAKVPAEVSDDAAAFTVLYSIGLHAIRLLGAGLGETVVVIGLGLIGLLTAELLRVSGCNVLGVEPDQERAEVARQRGVQILRDNIEQETFAATGGLGADGVIITAASKNTTVAKLAVRLAKQGGKIVVTGSVPLHFDRNALYQKELTILVSRSYGPGRYDPDYEHHGNDYPIAYVRWTENRNFQAILQMLKAGTLAPIPLISNVLDIENAVAYYTQKQQAKIASLIDFKVRDNVVTQPRAIQKLQYPDKVAVGLLGAGNYSKMTLLPALNGFPVKTIASESGLSALAPSRKYRIPNVGTSMEILADPEINLVLIATRHYQHAEMAGTALRAGKHVFVEKPLAMNATELEQLSAIWRSSGKTISVGYNRRFAPSVLKMKKLLGANLMNVTITVNAGKLPEKSWLTDKSLSGGRIIGEACHFLDLITFLTGSQITEVCSNQMQECGGDENVTILLRYQNGSAGAVHYFSNGHINYQKERIEVYSGGRVLILDDFKRLYGYGFRGFSSQRFFKDKGHKTMFRQLFSGLESDATPLIPFDEICNASLASFATMESLQTRRWVAI